MPVLAGTEDAYKPIKKSMLKTVGKTLAKVGAPLPTALIDGYFVGKQIQEDKPAAEIASGTHSIRKQRVLGLARAPLAGPAAAADESFPGGAE